MSQNQVANSDSSSQNFDAILDFSQREQRIGPIGSFLFDIVRSVLYRADPIRIIHIEQSL